MELTELPASIIAANVEELENRFLTTKVDFRWARNNAVEDAIEVLAKYGKEETISAMAEAEDLDRSSWSDALIIQAMSELHALWVDTNVFIGRDDNLLNREVKVDDTWQMRFKQAMVGVLLAEGELMNHNASYYGWKEYDNIPNGEIVGVFNLRTDEWGLFEGTMAPEETHTGITAEVLYANGIFRNFRYEADLATMMRSL